MTLALYGILVVLALFIVLMVFNPNLSCFGRRLRSPIYPLLRRKKQQRMKTTDYGFHLGVQSKKNRSGEQKRSKPGIVAKDYGFSLGGERKETAAKRPIKAEKLVSEEYGFDLREKPNKKKNKDLKDSERKKE